MNMLHTPALPVEQALIRIAWEALPNHAQVLHDIFYLSPLAIFGSTPSGEIIFWNPAAERMFGWSEAEVLGRCSPIVPPEKQAEAAELRARVIAGETMTEEEVVRRRRDGSLVHFSFSTTALHDAGGSRVGIIFFAADITKRKRAEASLHSLNEQLDQLVEQRTAQLAAANERLRLSDFTINNASLGIHWAGPDSRILRVNQATCDILGYSEEELLGMSVSEIESTTVSREGQARSHDAKHIKFEASYRRKDGQSVPVELDITPLEFEGVEYQVVFFQDITERRRATTELERARSDAEQASRAKSSFLATVSHEIRTPMNGVIGMADVLRYSELSAGQSDAVQTIRDSALALLTIIDDILDYSKIEAGKFSIERAPVCLADIVNGVADMITPLAAKKGIEFGVLVDPQIPNSVLADSGRLRQVLNNLLGNAVKFTGVDSSEPGRIDICAERVSASSGRVVVRFSITDNGIGIAADVLPRLFRPFSQADSSTTRRFGGTGLGLSICDQLVKLMGGSIDVRSAPGEGSTFVVTIPFDVYFTSPLPDAQAQPAAKSRSAARKIPILVADDNEVNQKVMLHQLGLLGYAAAAASDGRQALERWRAGRYGLMFCDLHMPQVSGHEVAATIRAEEGERTRMPIIAFTAAAGKGEVQGCFEAGMDDYLSKPVRLETLRAVLEKWIPESEDLLQARTGSHDEAAATCRRDAAPPVDVEVLKTYIGNDAAVIERTLGLFLTEVRKDRDELRSAYASHDAARLKAVSHRLKSSAYSVGATQLGETCAELERASAAGCWPDIDTLAARFDECVRAVEAHLADRAAAGA